MLSTKYNHHISLHHSKNNVERDSLLTKKKNKIKNRSNLLEYYWNSESINILPIAKYSKNADKALYWPQAIFLITLKIVTENI